ncbi:MAG TPA: ribonuclease E/G [Caulobacteraceae bacterium]|nr:ribonuclease E/G [Caulobacteraceae bacterium]
MAERRAFLDEGPLERRGVVTLNGRPERLFIERGEPAPGQQLGARSVGRVRRLERAAGLAFVELAAGPDAVLPLGPETGGLTEGAWIEAEVRSEAQGRKGPRVRLIGPADGPLRLLAAGPGLEERLAKFAAGEVVAGRRAREIADVAQAEALARSFALPGGGRLTVEPTQALVAIDVDLGERPGSEPKRAQRAANLAAIGLAARVLRLKGLGGLVAIDLVGRGHDGPALLAAARAAFGADNPGVAMTGPSRFGLLELTIPRRIHPALEQLVDDEGWLLAAAIAADLARRLEDEARADPGGAIEARACAEVAAAVAPAVAELNRRIGGRARVVADPALPRERFEVASP